MTIVVVGIIASYIILTAMLLIFSLRTNFHWGIKTATVIVVSIFYITSYLAFFSILGWPSARDLPETFRLISAQINESDQLLSENNNELFCINRSSASQFGFGTDIERKELNDVGFTLPR